MPLTWVLPGCAHIPPDGQLLPRGPWLMPRLLETSEFRNNKSATVGDLGSNLSRVWALAVTPAKVDVTCCPDRSMMDADVKSNNVVKTVSTYFTPVLGFSQNEVALSLPRE